MVITFKNIFAKIIQNNFKNKNFSLIHTIKFIAATLAYTFNNPGIKVELTFHGIIFMFLLIND